jgi:hypothetical protein
LLLSPLFLGAGVSGLNGESVNVFKGTQVWIGRVVNASEDLELLVHRIGELDIAQAIAFRRVVPERQVLQVIEADPRGNRVRRCLLVGFRVDEPELPAQFGAVGLATVVQVAPADRSGRGIPCGSPAPAPPSGS